MEADCRDRTNKSSPPFIKLVHPKGVVELLTRPTRASDVMKKHPRHCVTRPDFFKYPWIVVHPDSVLKLGCTFYVVPFHTMDRLLKQSRPEGQHNRQVRGSSTTATDHCSLEMIGFDQLLLEHRRSAKSAPEEIRSKVDCRYGELRTAAMFPNCLLDRSRQQARSETKGGDSPQSWPPRTALSYYKKYGDPEEEEQFEDCKESFGDCSRLKRTTLKPCLRKSSSGGSRGPDIRVKFTLPGEDHAKLRLEIFEFQRAD
ncbi:hypothetical protein LINGRAPRIM_LOCUS3226 [Linum grandiflorum]